ncbi:sensor histidine kinase [Paenactinomyces guangxiensis]|uniref:histidine kinase n=1 Tax=Paenactinomyces guangxiensis TaxID=1490290 RepID=A0A7W1WNT5_9BACL|nr:sensor histidine kinase [Paenactinomyces guangxiensis]MBA4493317.1 histidine kinase [Paenactinomyces guangxiensis]MBH8589832.1 histidine kinase [Paenactinomyces guangxiensis]
MWKRLRQMMLPHSFRFNLMFASVTCILIPACISLTIYNYLTKDEVKEQAITNSQESLQLVDVYVTNLLNDMLYIANYIQIDSEMTSILKESAAGKIYQGPDAYYQRFMDQRKIISKIDNITLVGEKSCYVTILLKNGQFYTNYQVHEYHPVQLFKEPWFERLNGLYGFESYWVGTTPTVFQSEKSHHPYQISIARTLREGDSNIYGYVVVTVLESQVNQIFKKLAVNQETMLVDSSGKILSHKDSSQIGKLFPYVKQVPEQNGSRITRISGEDYLITKHSLSFSDWSLVSLTPYQKAETKINYIFNQVFIFQLVSFFIFLFLLIYLLRKFTRPLIQLGKIANTVQHGNLEVRSNIRGQDEIGQLGLSFDLMLDRVEEMIAQITLTQARKRKAELAMLQAQINPHFLFNVLNSIRMKVMGKGDKESAEMISSLSKLLRMTISHHKGNIHFHEELETVMDYVQLMNMRQKEKIELELNVSSEAFLQQVPRFFLQPVIENALIHAYNQSAGKIVLHARLTGRQLIVIVEDSGQGMSKEALQALREKIAGGNGLEDTDPESHKGFSGIGLPNVYERMRMIFGESFRMEVDSEHGKGTRITMFIPVQEAYFHV